MNVETMERLLEFCIGKIPDEDMLALHDMLAKGVPAKEMAADAAIKGRQILAMDCQARGYSVVNKRGLMAIAADRDAIVALTPDMFRLSDGSAVGAVPAGKVIHSKQPSRPMTASERAAASKAFPNMFKGD